MSQRGAFVLVILISITLALLLTKWPAVTAQGYMTSTTTYSYTSVRMSSSTAMLTSQCEYFPRPYTDDMITVDQTVTQVHFQVSSDYPIDLYVMDSAQFESFVSGSCGNFYASNSQYVAQAVRSYSFNWAPPGPGDYYVIVYNRSSLPTNVSLTVTLIGMAQETMTSYLAPINTVTSVISGTLSQPPPTTNSQQNFNEVVLLCALLVIIAIACALVIRSRKATRRRGTEIYLEDNQWRDSGSSKLRDDEGTQVFERKKNESD